MIQLEGNQLVGGLWCSDILATLSQYLDGELDSQTAARVDDHLQGCSNCARFGADVSGMLVSLSGHQPELSEEKTARLAQALSEELERSQF
jgi:anti-sigma factor RsiW